MMSDPRLLIGALAVAAVAHAAWNVMVKTSGDPLRLAARAVSSSALLLSPVAAAIWVASGRPGLPPAAWLLVALSAVVELVYFILLSTAYRRGELSVVYPIARGTAPVLSVLAGITILGERFAPVQVVGVGCLLAGIWAARLPAGRAAGVLPALATGVAIAGYSFIDRVGVRLGPPWLYAWALWSAIGILLMAWTALRRGQEPPAVESWSRSVVVGLLMTTAYVLVLLALSVAPLAAIAPLRESATVLVTAWGMWRLRERTAMLTRALGAASIVTGAYLLSFR